MRPRNGGQALYFIDLLIIRDHLCSFVVKTLFLECYRRFSRLKGAIFEPVDEEIGRNIKTLFNFEPPVTDEEIRAASLQFVRKLSGFNKPSKANEAAFLAAVDEIAAVSRKLLSSLETSAPPKNRAEETAKVRARSAQRFPPAG